MVRDYLPQEDMPLNDTDKGWIKNAIADALTGHFKGWKETIRIWSLPSVSVAILLFLFTQWEKYVEFRTHSLDRLDSIEKNIKDIDSGLLTLRISQVSSTPNEKKSQIDAGKILANARKSAIPIPLIDVEDAGKNFVGASKENQDAWSVALDFVSYRTGLNVNLLQVGTAQQIATTPVDRTLETHYEFSAPKGYPLPTASVGGDVPIEQAAMLYKLGSQPKSDARRGKQVILIEGGTLLLDQTAMKHVVVRNTQIFYQGGPALLEDEIFVNCRFVMFNDSAARTLALAVLAHSTVNFNPAAV